MNEQPRMEDAQEGVSDTSLDEVSSAELEDVAQTTSRKLLTLLVIGGFLLVAIHATSLGQQVRDWDKLADLFKGGGGRAEIYFVLLSSLLIMAGVPRLLFCAVGGFAFGFWEGLFWSMFSSLVGSFAAFRAARWGGREWLAERFGKKRFFGRIMLAKPNVVSVALIRQLPVSNAIINIGLALGHVGNRAFLFGSLIGFLPQGVVAVVFGSGVAHDVPWAGAGQMGVAAVLLLAVFLWASKKHWKRR